MNALEKWFTAIDAPGGFLFEWWSVFWDIFIARTNEKHSEVAASYIEVSLRMHCFLLVVVYSVGYISFPMRVLRQKKRVSFVYLIVLNFN